MIVNTEQFCSLRTKDPLSCNLIDLNIFGSMHSDWLITNEDDVVLCSLCGILAT